MRFKNDWAGVFIRGDHAFTFVYILKKAVHGLQLTRHEKGILALLSELLEECNQDKRSEPCQEMKEFSQCLDQ
jgi:hypothetical protein